ncbi:hypothetical protein LMG27174_01986 [Paraburkholderia rhynchosiae]|uniref:Uncharacterized protein n=1 Tax=Paraburkholderia rhynchosiae TaxID=487049 RepID=A0A6J5ANV7_9BURK|nr:hypothetical protein LMG27174_01986 [Paraburkholderia rhynchosiae]
MKAKYFGMLIYTRCVIATFRRSAESSKTWLRPYRPLSPVSDHKPRSQQLIAQARRGRFIGSDSERGGVAHRLHQALAAAAGRCMSGRLVVFFSVRSLLIIDGADDLSGCLVFKNP